jgi:DNA-binding CsgD family transcriptional regulator
MKTPLTKFQVDFLKLFLDGSSRLDVSNKLYIDLESVNKNAYRIKKRLNVSTFEEAIEYIRTHEGAGE